MSDQHWNTFTAFVKAELAAGGPDPQIALLGALGAGQPLVERVWLAGCYGACHCVPTAFATWLEWRPEQAAVTSQVEGWLRAHWDGLPVRPEMRSHRMPEKRALCLSDFAVFAQAYPDKHYKDYNDLWNHSVSSVKYYGRYMAIKYLEMLHRFGEFPYAMPDFRAKGGWSPRKALAALWPLRSVLAERDNETPEALRQVDLAAEDTILKLKDRGVTVSMFQLQVLACEYKEALAGGFYAGAGHDEEMSYMDTVERRFGAAVTAPIYLAREALFDKQYLGEHGGWFGVRKDKYVAFKAGDGV